MLVTSYPLNNYSIKSLCKNYNNNTYKGKYLPETECKNMIEKLNCKMSDVNSKLVQNLYQYGIDFLKNNNKEKFINNMYKLIKYTPKEEWKNISDNEFRYIGNYGVYFDLKGNNPKCITVKNIVDSFSLLI